MFLPHTLAAAAPKNGGHIDEISGFLKNCCFPAARYRPIPVVELVNLMELLLNLTWLLLAVPAYWLWQGSRHFRFGRKLSAGQCILSIGCMLVVLFPVISATDDLHAMRTEMEESAGSKRHFSPRSGEKPPSWKWQAPPALPQSSGLLFFDDEHRLDCPVIQLPVTATLASEPSGRAPPFSRV
jgi:hypothetical protein